jgi:hypothetical protein
VDYNPFNEGNRVELKPDNHLQHHNVYIDLERVQWKPNGQQVEDKF